jgi:hypothetical protein
MDEELRRLGMARWWGQYLPPAGFPKPGPTREAVSFAGAPISQPKIVRRSWFGMPYEEPMRYTPGSAWQTWKYSPPNVQAWIAPNPAKIKNVGNSQVRVVGGGLRIVNNNTSPYVYPNVGTGGWQMAQLPIGNNRF